MDTYSELNNICWKVSLVAGEDGRERLNEEASGLTGPTTPRGWSTWNPSDQGPTSSVVHDHLLSF